MKLTIESTDQIARFDPSRSVGQILAPDGKVSARVWRGTTERGVSCLVYVVRVLVRSDQDISEFDAALRPCGDSARSTGPSGRAPFAVEVRWHVVQVSIGGDRYWCIRDSLRPNRNLWTEDRAWADVLALLLNLTESRPEGAS